MTFWNGRTLNLYHGTTRQRASIIATSGPDISMSRPFLDFGKGFYTTTRLLKANEWAISSALKHRDHPAIVRFSVKYDKFQVWRKISFADAGKSADDFWDFVRLNRRQGGPHRSPPGGYFGVVVGPVSKSYRTRAPVSDFDQISFHTPNAIRDLTAESQVTIHSLHATMAATSGSRP